MRASDPLIAQLRAHLDPSIVLAELIDRQQWSGDASIYHLIPQVVVMPRQVEDVQIVLRIAQEHLVAVCFRAGGTSLSGQAVTDGIMIVVSRHLRAIQVHAGGMEVTCEPGAVGAWVNAALSAHARRIGPDPASMQAAQIGGIVANNASGMCCGITQNSYQTVTGLDLVLCDGFRFNTAAENADEQLHTHRPHLFAGLLALKNEVRRDGPLCQRIATAFQTKNTVGYSLNAFLDEETPARILQRLIIGAEGTLAFIAAATLRTFALPRSRATGWLLFSSIEGACLAVEPLRQAGAAAIELMDALALRRVAKELPYALPAGEPAALLIEFHAGDEPELAQRIAQVAPMLLDHDLVAPASFTTDPAQQARLWKMRKGLFPSVAALRAAGTAVVIEDVTFPVAQLAAGVRALRTCFNDHGYADAVIFGHAKDGNLHFTLTPDFSQAQEVTRYDNFMRAMVDLVLGQGGHLKAEHGTGRNMAPFVARQWGGQAVDLMRRIKALLDPNHILNPGVLLSDDPQAHLRHLKTFPMVDPLIDRCSECGFCEPVCPSRDLTYSPRQRIAALRAMAREGALADAVATDWKLRGLDSCAADGMCATACPLHINTADVVLAQRAQRRSAAMRGIALVAERHVSAVAVVARGALRILPRLYSLTRKASRIPLPTAAGKLPAVWPSAALGEPTFIYLPSCISQVVARQQVPQQLAVLCQAAGVGIVVPAGVGGLCCGQAFASKGFAQAAANAAARAITAIAAVGAPGISGVISDISSCAAHLFAVDVNGDDDDDDNPHELPRGVRQAWKQMRRYHPASFAHEILIPRLRGRGLLRATPQRSTVHPTCADMQAGWEVPLMAAAQAGCEQALAPAQWGCCGMAGDKGWTLPGLSEAASKREAAGVQESGATQGICSSTTCAQAMETASGIPYHHIFTFLAAGLATSQDQSAS